jgi:3-phosphoshikimate 1-carboxyvinyltransferase
MAKTAAKKKEIPASGFASRPVKKFGGRCTVPGDKSISHRALMLSSQAIGASRITGLLESEDVIHTAGALKLMGVGVEKLKDGAWEVEGLGTGGLQEPAGLLDMGNSGTACRLMMGLVTPYPYSFTFDGDASLRKRPMKRVIMPLEMIGAEVVTREGGRLPLTLKGTAEPLPITYELPVASAQVKSAVMLAGLNTPGITTVVETRPTRDHTERMMRFFGADVKVTKKDGRTTIAVTGQPELKGRDISIPADPSSAAFLVVAALLVPKAELTVTNVCINPERIGLYKTLIEMGGDIEFKNKRHVAGEEVADIIARASDLKGIKVPAERAPSMIDEYPILAVAASKAKGTTRMLGLEELKVKESDRLSAIVEGLKANGVKAKAGADSLEVSGGEIPGGGMVSTHMDHRIAMSFLVMGMMAKKAVKVDDVAMIQTSFPGFLALMNRLGASMEAA